MICLAIYRRCIVLLFLLVVVGCKESTSSEITLKESELQTSINKQLPINGLVNVHIHIPDDIASLSGLFAHRIIEDPLVEAKIVLSEVEVSLIGGQNELDGKVELLAKPLIRVILLGIQIEEPLSVEILGGIKAERDKLFLTDIEVNEKGSFFLNNLVPDEYKKQFIMSLSDWFIAYFSAYPILQLKEGDHLAEYKLDEMTRIIEDDLIRFSQ
jgi:hypothetical protein